MAGQLVTNHLGVALSAALIVLSLAVLARAGRNHEE